MDHKLLKEELENERIIIADQIISLLIKYRDQYKRMYEENKWHPSRGLRYRAKYNMYAKMCTLMSKIMKEITYGSGRVNKGSITAA